VTISELGAWLTKRSNRLVYSLGNIRALVAPIVGDASQLSRIQEYVKQLERLPHCYVGSDVDLLELQSALRCFEAAKEYEPIDAYVPRFDYVLPSFANPNRLIYPLWDIVYDLWRACPKIFEPQPKFHELQALAMSINRSEPRNARSCLAEPLDDPILYFLVSKMSATQERAAQVASWIAADPSRCPGLRLLRAVGFAMSQNRTYAARKDDVFDMSQIVTVPYVDAATVDRTMLHYFSQAVRANTGPLASTPDVFRNMQDLMKALA